MTNDAHARRRVQCLFCSTTPTLNNFMAHLKTVHPDQYVPGAPRRSYLVELEAPRSFAVVVPTPAPEPPVQQPLPEVTLDHGMTVDDIVVPAIMTLAMPGNVVPVAHLGALFLWRDQTAAMLAAISGKVSQ